MARQHECKAKIAWGPAALVWPLAGHGIKEGLLALEVPGASRVPTAVLAYGVEASVRAARSLV